MGTLSAGCVATCMAITACLQLVDVIADSVDMGTAHCIAQQAKHAVTSHKSLLSKYSPRLQEKMCTRTAVLHIDVDAPRHTQINDALKLICVVLLASYAVSQQALPDTDYPGCFQERHFSSRGACLAYGPVRHGTREAAAAAATAVSHSA